MYAPNDEMQDASARNKKKGCLIQVQSTKGTMKPQHLVSDAKSAR